MKELLPGKVHVNITIFQLCLVAWPSDESEAESDLAMIGTSLLFLC